MKYSLSIRKHNEKAHVDIEQDIQQKTDGLFTFVLRINNGNIVDYNIMEYVDATKYTGLEQSIIEEFTTAYHHPAGSGGNGIRTDNLQRGNSKRSGEADNA